jgi:hypothetical protein
MTYCDENVWLRFNMRFRSDYLTGLLQRHSIHSFPMLTGFSAYDMGSNAIQLDWHRP